MYQQTTKTAGKRSKRGSLLIEAILTVVILAVCLTVVIQSLLTSLKASVYTARYSQAALLMEGKLFEIYQQKNNATDLEEEGQFDAPFEQFRYKITAKPWEDDCGLECFYAKSATDTAPALNLVDVEIIWQNGVHEQKLSVTTSLMGAVAIPEEEGAS